MKEATIKELAEKLQKKIDIRMEHFVAYYDKLKSLYSAIEESEKKMAEIALELEPVQSLIYIQNPQLEEKFESLKRIYGKEDNGTS